MSPICPEIGVRICGGGLRDRQVFIGPTDAPITDARFVPAPHGDQLKAAFEAWLAWVNRQDVPLPPVVQAGLAHYEFETLHPYSDGNGRIGRLAIVLQLIRLGVLRDPILVVSPWFEDRRVAYQEALLTLSITGDWDAWIAFFATGVEAAADTTHRRVAGCWRGRRTALRRVREARASGLAERLAAELIGLPVLRAGQSGHRDRCLACTPPWLIGGSECGKAMKQSDGIALTSACLTRLSARPTAAARRRCSYRLRAALASPRV